MSTKPSEPEPGEPPLILIADDDRLMRSQLRYAMEREGYRVAEAENGEECLAVFGAVHPAIILLDARMPVMDGFTCCRLLQDLPHGDRTPVLIVTGLEDQASVDQAFAVGATDYVTKPIHWAVLCQRVRRLIQQTKLYQQVQQLNTDLDRQVQERTAQLHQSLIFEAMLKRITDKVRDSLDEVQILQTAVQELSQVLGVQRCDTVLYDLDQNVARICCEYKPWWISSTHQDVLNMIDCQEIYTQLLQGQYLQFCELPGHVEQAKTALLACPIIGDAATAQGVEQKVLGDLWLVKPASEAFDELEIRLVQQVANQCAIALRQAHLYQAAQNQVQQLERLNHLKDDFLCTVSHELRTPVASMKMSIQMLDFLWNQERKTGTSSSTNQIPGIPPHTDPVTHYLQILRNECDRELGLINDLLALQQLDTDVQLSDLSLIRLQDWLPHVLEPFELQVQEHQQALCLDIETQLPACLSDLFSLGRILTELLNNACKYTPPGEKIVVIAQRCVAAVLDAASCPLWAKDRYLNCPDPSPGELLQISICNSGIEIPPQELPLIFEKFYRIPSNDPWKHGGTGLGLALVKKLIDHLRGKIWVESANNQTTFTIQIPTQFLESEQV